LESNFAAFDWVIVTLYLLGSAAAGLWCKRFVRSMRDFTVAGQNLRSYLGVATMIGTELGLVTVMFAAQMGVNGGLSAFHIALLAGVVTLIVGWTGFIVVPLRRLGVMTIPEYYERRFGRGVRVYGGFVLALSGILNMGLFLRAGADFIVGVTGAEAGNDYALQLKIIMTVLLALVLFYTMLGGMISIILTDYIQFVVLSLGMLVTCGFAISEVGWDSIVNVVQFVETPDKPAGKAAVNPFFVNDKDQGYGSMFVVWQAFIAMVSCAIWQTAVMRACAASSEKVVKRMYVWSSIGFLIRWAIPMFLGICALAYFVDAPKGTPVVVDDYGTSSMLAMPTFLGEILPSGILGIVTAGMLAAFMSTHDSYLLCWSSVITQDVVSPCFREKGISEKAKLLLTRISIFTIGVFLLVWGLWYPLGDDLWGYMAITGAIYFTGAFALLAIGLYSQIGSRVGAYLALSAGFFALLGLDPVKKVVKERYEIEISEPVLGLGSIAAAVVLYFIGSLLFPDKPKPEATEEN